MDLFHCKLFRDIASTGSMSRGAQMSQISQSAASQHVQEVERNLAVTLFDRSSRPMRLTEAGHLYNELCKEMLRLREEFDQTLAEMKSSIAGHVRVVSIFSVGLVDMARLEEEFRKRYPATSLEVEYVRPERVYEALRSDAADIGLVSYPHSAKDLAVIPWREEEMVVASSPLHAVARRKSARPADLEGLDFIGFDPELPIRKEVDRYLRESGVGVKVSKHFDSIPMIKEALAVGGCVSILPLRMLRQEVGEGRLNA
ncbi:MAG: LysR family transcriptional regulator, partial [Candidatus Solibacter usitatus]|nr:LysR family transcriptional regulator [Candidatus Solibacter usitatus]